MTSACFMVWGRDTIHVAVAVWGQRVGGFLSACKGAEVPVCSAVVTVCLGMHRTGSVPMMSRSDVLCLQLDGLWSPSRCASC